jgi:hypothetical protein
MGKKRFFSRGGLEKVFRGLKAVWAGFIQIATVAAGAAAVVAIVIAVKAWRSSVEGSRELVERLDTISLRMAGGVVPLAVEIRQRIVVN